MVFLVIINLLISYLQQKAGQEKLNGSELSHHYEESKQGAADEVCVSTHYNKKPIPLNQLTSQPILLFKFWGLKS